MPAIPTKLYEAFEKIRLGKVEEGTRLFDRVDGFEPVKAVALAELSYFRHEWKRGIEFSYDFLASETDWETVRYYMRGYKELHLKAFLLATCHLDAWKENRTCLEQLRKEHDSRDNSHAGYFNNANMYQQAISLISDPVNTKRLLLESRPKLKKEGKIDAESLEHKARHAVLEHRRSRTKGYWRQSLSFDDLVHEAFSKASSEDHIALYERYADRLEKNRSHQEAAKSYIALENLQEAKEAIRQCIRGWEFKEPYQVAPIELFTDPELWPVMSDRRFTESLLTIPHHRES